MIPRYQSLYLHDTLRSQASAKGLTSHVHVPQHSRQKASPSSTFHPRSWLVRLIGPRTTRDIVFSSTSHLQQSNACQSSATKLPLSAYQDTHANHGHGRPQAASPALTDHSPGNRSDNDTIFMAVMKQCSVLLGDAQKSH